MARFSSKRRRAQQPPILPPNKSLKSISIATLCFLTLIALAIGISNIPKPKRDMSSKISSSEPTRRVFGTPQDIPDALVSQFDVILVLGGGVPISLEEPPVFVQRRCDDAVQVVQRQQALSPHKNINEQSSHLPQRRLPILCLSAGTAHLPQLLSEDGLPIWEATSSAAYLLKRYGGTILEASQIYTETTSYDTIGNAFYARTSFTDISGWRNLLIVTNEFHMDRSKAIFDWIFGLEGNAKSSRPYKLSYLGPPNVGLTDDAVQARKKREVKSQQTVETVLSKKYTTLQGVWTFLTQDHALYTAHKLVDRGRAVKSDNEGTNSQALKESYGLNNKKSKRQRQDKEDES